MHQHDFSNVLVVIGDPMGSLDSYWTCGCGVVRHTYTYRGVQMYESFDEPNSFGAGYAHGIALGMRQR